MHGQRESKSNITPEEYLQKVTVTEVFKNKDKDLSFMIDVLIKSVEIDYVKPMVEHINNPQMALKRKIRPVVQDVDAIKEKESLLQKQFIEFKEVMQKIKESQKCTPDQLEFLLRYQNKLFSAGRPGFILEQVIRLAKPTNQKEGETYIVRLGNEYFSAWDSHDLFVGPGEPYMDDSTKVHLSFDRDELEKARNIIIGILEKKKLHSFKIVHSGINTVEELKKSKNLIGKEVTIYLQIANDYKNEAEKNPDFWIDLFNELEDALKKADINPNPQLKNKDGKLLPAHGDKFFPGSLGYLSYRNPENLLKCYIAAQTLAESGFTSTEASNLCPPEYDPIQIFFKDNKLHKTLECERKSDDSNAKDRGFTLEKVFPSNLDEQREVIKNGLIDRMWSLETDKVFFGEKQHQKIDKIQPFKEIVFMLKIAFTKDITEHGMSDVMKNLGLPSVSAQIKADAISLNQFFQGCLAEASEYIAKANSVLSAAGIPLPNAEALSERLVVAPAVYAHFFNPIITSWMKDPTKSLETSVDKQALIQAVFKCAFRDLSVAQTDRETPQYLGKLTDNELNRVFTYLTPTISLKESQVPVQPVSTIIKAETKVNQVDDLPPTPPLPPKQSEVSQAAPQQKIKCSTSLISNSLGNMPLAPIPPQSWAFEPDVKQETKSSHFDSAKQASELAWLKTSITQVAHLAKDHHKKLAKTLESKISTGDVNGALELLREAWHDWKGKKTQQEKISLLNTEPEDHHTFRAVAKLLPVVENILEGKSAKELAGVKYEYANDLSRDECVKVISHVVKELKHSPDLKLIKLKNEIIGLPKILNDDPKLKLNFIMAELERNLTKELFGLKTKSDAVKTLFDGAMEKITPENNSQVVSESPRMTR